MQQLEKENIEPKPVKKHRKNKKTKKTEKKESKKYPENKKIKRKPKKTNKHKYKRYTTNFNIAIGLIKDQINNMIEATGKEQKKIIEEIKKILLTNLIPIKEETQTNKKIKQKKTNYKFNDNNRRTF